jgi:hypothetical protein
VKTSWSPGWGLNPRPTRYECVALPLSYPGEGVVTFAVKLLMTWTIDHFVALSYALTERLTETHLERAQEGTLDYCHRDISTSRLTANGSPPRRALPTPGEATVGTISRQPAVTAGRAAVGAGRGTVRPGTRRVADT